MTNQEQQLIDAIKALPGHQVFPGRHGYDYGVIVVIALPNGVRQQSVWIGRNGTIDKLQSVLAAAKEA